MSRPLPLCRIAALLLVLLALTACGNLPVQTSDGFYPTSPLDSPLPTPDPDAAIYEVGVYAESPEDDYPRVVRLAFDPDAWRFAQSHVFNHVLINEAVPTCWIMQPHADPAEPDPRVLRTLDLGGREWTVHNDTWGWYEGLDSHIWQLRYRSAPYEFTLAMLNYVEPVTDASGRACIAAAEEVLSTLVTAPLASQPATADETVRPRVWLRAHEDAAGEPIIPDGDALLAESADWTRYASDRSGFSVAVPPGWDVVDTAASSIILTSPSGDEGQRIWLNWQATEKPSDRPLREWLEGNAGNEMTPFYDTVVKVSLPIIDPSGTSEQVRLEYSPVFVGGAYALSHGNLVLHIQTSSAWVDALPTLRAVASSIEFAEDAPMTLAEIPWR